VIQPASSMKPEVPAHLLPSVLITALVFLIGVPSPARGQLIFLKEMTASVNTLTVSNTDFANAGYFGKSGINVSAVLDFSRVDTFNNFTSLTREFRVGWQLLDGTGTPVQLDTGSGTSTTVYDDDWEGNADAGFPITLAAFDNEEQFTGFAQTLRPVSQLNPTETYTVRVIVSWQSGTTIFGFPVWSEDDSLEDGGDTYLHYTGEVSGDDPVNTLSILNSVSFSDRSALAGADPADDAYGFEVEADVTFHRFDEWLTVPLFSVVEILYEVELWRVDPVNGDEQIPLQQSSFSVAQSLQTHTEPFFNVPSTLNTTHFLRIVPDGVQLDSVNEAYYASVTIGHVENPVLNTEWTGNTESGAPQQLMHFNGTLDWGGIQTLIGDFTNDPATSASWSATYINSSLNGAVGVIAGNTGYTWGPTSPSIRLQADGTASVITPSLSVTVSPPASPDLDAVADIRFQRSNLLLNHGSGLSATVTLYLPTGMGYSALKEAHRFLGKIDFAGAALNQNLNPVDPVFTFNPGSTFYVMEESKPLTVGTNSITWTVAAGTVKASSPGDVSYVREEELARLESAPIPAEQTIKRSNEQYYRAVSGIASTFVYSVNPGPVGDARLSMDMDFGGKDFQTHFPYAVPISFNQGYLSLLEDLVDVQNSALDGIAELVLEFEQGCVTKDCGPLPRLQEMRLISQSDSLRFTRDGGLVTTGVVSTGGSAVDFLAWGFSEDTGFFHHQTTGFAEGDFHMPGHFIRGDQNTAPGQDFAPGVILYTGFLASDPTLFERPATHGYLDGLTDYAGFNYRTLSDSAFQSISHLTAKEVIFDLTGRCKYYIRHGGVTGIHEAVPGTFPESLELAGYQMTFSQYGLNYRSSQPGDSRTDGTIVLPYPSDFEQPFEQLRFTCLGALDDMKLPAGPNNQVMRYWLANIDIHSLRFESEDKCAPGSPAFLFAGVSAEAAYVDSPLIGTLGFTRDGELMTPGTSAAFDEDSRLKMPSVVRFDGPLSSVDPGNPGETRQEVYQLVTVSDAYYNDYASSSEKAEGDGKLNFAATLDVAFFEDLEVHVQTSPRNVLPSQSIPIHLMGGWKDGPDTFFNSTGFDSGNRGFPSGVAEAVYRNDPDNGGDPTPYLITAYQDWIGGLIEFAYPLQWSFTTRSFASYAPEEDKLVVINSQHQVDYLSAERAELSIGITYEGMPTINLTNFVINEVDKATGIYQAVLTEAKKPVVDALEDGIDEMAALLEDQMDQLYDEFLTSRVETLVVNPLFQDLKDLADDGNYTILKAHEEIVDRIRTDSNNLKFLLERLATDVNGANYLFDEIDRRLEDIELGLTALIEGGDLDVNGNLIPAANINSPDVAGFLSKNLQGDFQVLAPLVDQLLQELAPDISSELNTLLSGAVDDLNARINDLFESAKPTIDQIVVVLTDLRTVVGQVRTALQPAGQLLDEIQTVISDANGQIDTLTNEIVTQLDVFFATIPDSTAFLSYTEEEIKSRLRSEIRDLFFGSEFVADIQITLKQYLYDVDAAINAAISQAFAQVNEVMRDLVSDLLSEVDESINGFLGDIDSVMGAGKLDGYAQFNGDALRRLHIDLYLQLKVPDEMEFNGYLTIEQLDSDGDGSCGTGTPGEPYTEVKLGATDVPADWISPDLLISVGGKFVFGTSPDFRLLGMGGSFELTGGTINFEAFKITDIGAALMFGATENYLAAKVGVSFNSYEAFGGVYFGRTCSPDPLLLVDEDVADVIGEPNPTFTGIYVYGECHIPISEVVLGIPASCFFRISAGVGAGAFYFVEGNTLGGKIYAAVSGEALCIVGIKGEVTMIGVTQNGELRLRGKGRLSGKVGACPFCIKFGKTATITWDNGSWDVDI